MPSTSAHTPVLPAGGELAPSFEALLSLGLYAAIALFLVGILLLLAWTLGHKTRHPVKQQPYESGIAPTGSARLGEPVPFYLVAIFFIVFDVEIIFVVSWAVAYDLLGWAGFFQITFFIAMLFVGLLYLWKAGGLEWGPSARHRKGGGP
ncbi:MAG: NADH-quinone oxidoreductase subunit A [Desulfuromonadales bacterium]|nr:NADH-quinone oxidoreductase subunit A [Desulfuromonadales bacterium]MDW7756580.1 NADH-quinone oxidoreductase subunit A [Desulfuromonadales bacterium]